MQTLHPALSTASAGWPCPTQHCTSRRPRPVHAWHAWPTGVRQQAPTAVASLADARRCDQLTQTPAMTLAAPLDAADHASCHDCAPSRRAPLPPLAAQPPLRRARCTHQRAPPGLPGASELVCRTPLHRRGVAARRAARPAPDAAGQGRCPRRGSRLLWPRARVDKQGGWRRARGRLAGGHWEGMAGRRLPPRRGSEAPTGALARTRTTLNDNGASPPCAAGLHVRTATVQSDWH